MITLDNGKPVPLHRAIKYYKDQARCQRKLGLTGAEYASMIRILQRMAAARPSAPVVQPRLDPRAMSSQPGMRPFGGPEAAASAIETSFQHRPMGQYGGQGPGVSNKSLLERRFDISYRPVNLLNQTNQQPSHQRWQAAFQEQLGNEQLFSRTFDMAQNNQIPNVNINRQAMDCRRGGGS